MGGTNERYFGTEGDMCTCLLDSHIMVKLVIFYLLNACCIQVGNKIDLTEEREVPFLEASRFAQENSTFICLLLFKGVRWCESISHAL